MELFDVMRTTFAAREFTADPLPDDVLVKILDHARFAPSGGNRQGWKVIVVREQKTKDELARLSGIAAKRYAAQVGQRREPVEHDRSAARRRRHDREDAAAGATHGADPRRRPSSS